MNRKELAEKLNKFIDEEKRITGNDDRHTEGFRNGFKSSCTIIKEELKELGSDAKEDETEGGNKK